MSNRYSEYCMIINPRASILTLLDELHKNNIGSLLLNIDDPVWLNKYSEEKKCFEAIFYSTKGIELVTAQDISNKYNVTFVVAGNEDNLELVEYITSMVTPKYANDISTSKIRKNKFDMQEALRSAGIKAIKQFKFSINDINEKKLKKQIKDFVFPIFIKPNGSVSGISAIKCETHIEFLKKIQMLVTIIRNSIINTSLSEEIIVQESINGEEYLVNSFSFNGEHYISGIYSCDKILVKGISQYHSVNAINPIHNQNIIEYVRKVLTALGVKNGMVNADLIKVNTELFLLEINCRIVGLEGLISELETKIFGYNQAMLIVAGIKNKLYEYFEFPQKFVGNGKVVLLQDIRNFYDDNLKSISSNIAHKWVFDNNSLTKATSPSTEIEGLVLLYNLDKNLLEKDYLKLREMEAIS